MNQKTMQKLIENYVQKNGSDKLSDYISSILEEEKTLQLDIQCYCKNSNDEEKRHDVRLKQLRNTLYDIQLRCPHDSQTYHSDPSGGSDSSYECDLCGKEI